MEDHYKTLGVNSSATADEIRRAYRVLARRYHPDVNPGKAASEERFKAIASAYAVLCDVELRRQYDSEYQEQRRAGNERARRYQQAQTATQRFYEYQARLREQRERETRDTNAAASEAARPGGKTTRQRGPAAQGVAVPLDRLLAAIARPLAQLRDSARAALPGRNSIKGKNRGATRLSIIEVSVSVRDAIYGVRKTVEIAEPEGARKVSVSIPPGVRNGSVVRLRSKSTLNEDLVLVLRVAAHPSISIQPKGLVVEVPITVSEALSGATIKLPTLDDQLMVRIPAGSQSGQEIRIKEKGIANRDGSRGDLFYRLLIKVPPSAEAVGLKEKAQEFEQYYGTALRQNLPSTILEL